MNLDESLVTNVLKVQQEIIDPKELLNEIMQVLEFRECRCF